MPRRAAVLLALIVLLGSSCAHRPSPSADREREALRQRERGFLAALGAGDLERTTAYFAQDAMLHVANMPSLRGRPAIVQFYGNLFRFLRTSEAMPETMHVSASGDLAYTSGRVSNVFRGEQGTSEFAGKYLLIWEKRAGEWEVVVYSISDDGAGAAR
jgi:ketosteroid isomerase-like protein